MAAVRRTPAQIAIMRKAGRVVAEMHAAVRAAARPGVTLLALDQAARDVLDRRGARSNFLGYHGFPAVICASPNDIVVHGIPDGTTLEEGDLLSIDCGAVVDGWHGDAAFSMVVGGPEANPPAARLIEATDRALADAIAAARVGARIADLAKAVTTAATDRGYDVVEQYVGHGIGLAMHEEPDVPNRWPLNGPNPRLRPGMCIAIEPILTEGRAEVQVDPGGWTVRTLDGGLAAHAEHSMAVTADGVEILTLP